MADVEVNSTLSFPAVRKNIYGKYLKATYLKRDRVAWIFCVIVFPVMTVAAMFWIIPNAEYYMSDDFIYLSGSGGSFRRHLLSRSMPLFLILSPILPFFSLFFLIPFLPKGFELGNYAWVRMYRWFCNRGAKEKFLDLRDTFFNHFERHPMQVDIKRDRIIVYDEDGNQREVTFDTVTQAYRGHSLLVLHAGSLSVPDDEIIIDYSQLPRKERSDFLWFIDSRLLAECKCYYFRKVKPRAKGLKQ